MTAPEPPCATVRQNARQASGEFLLLAEWECSVVWLLEHTEKWPRNVRASLTQRFENTALELLELLIRGRYQPKHRAHALNEANLLVERLRYLCRIAHARRILSTNQFEAAVRKLDTLGRMLFGWRRSLGSARAHSGGHATGLASG
jgi:hypothetical protein